MMQVSWHRLITAFFVCVAAYFLSGGVFAATKHTQTLEGLDHLIPRDKWAGAGLDKLTVTEQQTLADDITSLLATTHTAEQRTSPTKDRSQWRKLQRQMTKDAVRKLLGEPDTISVSRFSESWYYVGGSVTFNSKGHVDMWCED